jgi:hypothetical protein
MDKKRKLKIGHKGAKSQKIKYPYSNFLRISVYCCVSLALSSSSHHELVSGSNLFRDAETQPAGWQEVRHDDTTKPP